jgi:hypothetical protein
MGLPFGNMCTAVQVIFDFGNPIYRLKFPHKVLPNVLIRGSIDDARRDAIYLYALLDV